MRLFPILLLLGLSIPAHADSPLPPAPYADTQLSDAGQEAQARADAEHPLLG